MSGDDLIRYEIAFAVDAALTHTCMPGTRAEERRYARLTYLIDYLRQA